MTEKNGTELTRLVKLLEEKPMTTAQVAKRTACSKTTAHRRLARLVELNLIQEAGITRAGRAGPVSVVYRSK